MRLVDWLTITAILLGPIIAIRLQTFIEKRRNDYGRKERIFKTLMATRATRLSLEHVQALNMIDIEFYDRKVKRSRKNKVVVDAWKEYLDHLSDKGMSPELWNNKSNELFIELMHAMSIALGYDFDRTAIKNTSYMPTAHGAELDEQAVIRKGFAAIFKGEKIFPMEWVRPDPTEAELGEQKKEKERQARDNKITEDYLSGKTPTRVIIIDAEQGLRPSSDSSKQLEGEPARDD
jgi:uncharacterized protein DUF6680